MDLPSQRIRSTAAQAWSQRNDSLRRRTDLRVAHLPQSSQQDSAFQYYSLKWRSGLTLLYFPKILQGRLGLQSINWNSNHPQAQNCCPQQGHSQDRAKLKSVLEVRAGCEDLLPLQRRAAFLQAADSWEEWADHLICTAPLEGLHRKELEIEREGFEWTQWQPRQDYCEGA